MPKQIAAAGWDNWGNADNEKTTLYAEYNNTGEGAAVAGRVSWAKQLSAAEAKQYTIQNIFSTVKGMGAKTEKWY